MDNMTEIGKKACQICGSSNEAHLRPASLVRPEILAEIKQQNSWDANSWICERDFNKYRSQYIEKLLREARGEISEIEKTVLESFREDELVSKNPEVGEDTKLTFGERLADLMASFGGSWTFIVLFLLFFASWVVLNSLAIGSYRFDPFPFIFLNLLLSCIAAIQAPIIMMSQNRQEARDREKALQDYKINLKAELEIRQLHQKIDHLLKHQWQRLLEIQQIQMDLMDEMQKR